MTLTAGTIAGWSTGHRGMVNKQHYNCLLALITIRNGVVA